MKTIICIVGASGSGKTTICQELEKKYNIPTVVSYTTRPKREGEINGVDHNFVLSDIFPDKKKLAYTKFGGFEYWVYKDQIDKCPFDAITYVIDEDGVRYLEEFYGKEYHIVRINIKRGNLSQVDEQRKQRDEQRKPLDRYDFTIENNGTIDGAATELAYIIEQIILRQNGATR